MQPQTEAPKAKRSSGGDEVPPGEYLARAVRKAIDTVTKQGSISIHTDAARLLRDYAHEDMRLLRLLTDAYLEEACTNKINAALRIQNGAGWYAKVTGTSKTVDAAIRRAKGAGAVAKRSFMDVVLPSGVQVRHATMKDFAEAAAFTLKQSRTMAVRGTAYTFCRDLLISKNAKETDLFGNLVTIEEAEKVRDMAEEAVGEVFSDH